MVPASVRYRLLPTPTDSSFRGATSDISEAPSRSAEVLSSELISTVAKIQYQSWRDRKLCSDTTDPRPLRAYEELPESERNYIRNLVNGKLTYYVSAISREGIAAMIAVGTESGSLSMISKDAERSELRLTSYSDVEPIREVMGRLEHENSLNHYAAIEWVHEWNYEWGEYPKELEYGYEYSRMQADYDCQMLATLPAPLQNRLLSLATPSVDGRFFVNDEAPTVRSHDVIQPPNAGHQFLKRLSTRELVEVMEHLVSYPAGERYYEIHGFLDRFQVGATEREIIKTLLYPNNGARASPERVKQVVSVLETIDVPSLCAESVTDLVRWQLLRTSNFVGPLNHRVESTFSCFVDDTFREEWRSIFLAQDKQLEAGLPKAVKFFMRWDARVDPSQAEKDVHVSDAVLAATSQFAPQVIEEIRAVGERMISAGVFGERELARRSAKNVENGVPQEAPSYSAPQQGVLLRDGTLGLLTTSTKDLILRVYDEVGISRECSPYVIAVSIAQLSQEQYNVLLYTAASKREAVKSSPGLRIEQPHTLLAVQELVRRECERLLSRDYHDLAPILRQVDGMGDVIDTPEFFAICRECREVASARSELLSLLTVSMLSAQDCVPFLKALREGRQLLRTTAGKDTIDFDGILSLSEAQVQRIQTQWKVYSSTKAAVVVGADTLTLPHGFTHSEWITLSNLDANYEKLRALIEPRILARNPDGSIKESGQVAQSGGILVDKFQYRDNYSHLVDGNWILVKRRSLDPNSPLDGAFIYNRPGVIATSLIPVVDAVAQPAEVSFAELFVTSIDRTSGTYQQLLAGMAARLALAGVRYSMGTMLEGNDRHSSLLVKNDHYALLGASVYRDDLKARYIPMLWKLP